MAKEVPAKETQREQGEPALKDRENMFDIARENSLADTPAGSSSKTEMMELQFNLLRSALYHDEREQVLAWRSRFSNFLTIILGSSVFAALAEQVDWAAMAAAGLTVVIGAAALVYDYAGGARDHRDLKRRFYELLAETDEDDADLRAIARRMALAYADEPPVMYALNAVAHNRAGEALFADDFARLQIGWFARTLRHLVAFRAQSFPEAA